MTGRTFLFVALFSDHLLFAQPYRKDIDNSLKKDPYWLLHRILQNYPVSSIGPVVRGGRVTDIAVNPDNSKEYYVAYASGGIFKTVNNGITFEPIFEGQSAPGIGDIALAPSNSNVLYVGTGEKNSSRSSYAGSVMYKSTDAGMTWESIGLKGCSTYRQNSCTSDQS